MRLSACIRVAFTGIALLFLVSCGTTRYVPEGAYLLKKYEIKVEPQKKVPTATLSSYVRQRPNTTAFLGWKILLGIYNISPKKESGWSKFLKEVGEAPVLFDSTAVESSKINIDRYVTSQGYYFNTITDSIVYQRKKAIVYLNLQLGKQYRISSVRYVIPDSLMRSFVLPDTTHSLLKTNTILSEALLERESDRMTANLRKFGYYNFTKNSISFVADTLEDNTRAALTVHFKDGSRGDDLAPMAAARQRFKIERIQVFPNWLPEKASQDAGYVKKLDSIDYKGLRIYYPEKLNLRPGVITRVNRLATGEYYNEQLVNTTYNRFSSLRFLSGVTLQFDALNQQNRTETTTPGKDSTKAGVADGALVCKILLTPSKLQGYKINLEASSNSSGLIGISPAVSYFHKNIFKGGEWLTLGFMGNFQFKFKDPVKSTELGTSASISFPTFLFPIPQKWFNHYTPQTDLGASYSFQQRREFTRNILSVNFGYNWRSGERLYYRFNPVQLNIVRLYDVDSTFYQSLDDPFLINSYQDHFDVGTSFTFYYTTDNSPSPKRSYFYTRWTTDLSGNILSLFNHKMGTDSTGAHLLLGTAYSQYWRTDINAVYTWKPKPAHSVAMRLYGGIGVAYGNSTSMPFEKLFYAGGANSLRAWQARAVGPGSMPLDTTFSIPNQTGDIKLEANIEYRPKLFWKLEGALFADVGNIWTLRQEQGREAGAFRFRDFYKSIAVAGGVGLRLNLDFVLLRLDLGLVIRDPHLQKWVPPSDWFKANTYAFQFGVGYPFL